jgi:RNA polymerase sigma-70 factor (ECF subfamily)
MSTAAQPRNFATTRWSIVVAAGQRASAESREALTALCWQYWYPLYAYARRSGRTADQSRDLTQAFFARLIEKNDVSAADQRRGRFRSWLLTAFKNFLANEHDRESAQKRGGGENVVSLDADERYQLEPPDERTPEQLYARRWTLALMERALHSLRQEYEGRGKLLLFERLVCGLTGEAELPMAELAARLEMNENSVRQAMFRLRHRYSELLFAETDHTLENPEDREEELRGLLDSLK